MDIRKEFLEFFKTKGHQVYESMNLVPNDASLLFTNAGMVQFKDIFTGMQPAPKNKRATSSQLCIRAGGKHNDLENVGFTNRHHTLFEMLGNFSFGDYFKRDAIYYAWEFVTEVVQFPKEKLYISVHERDDEAFEIWSQLVSVDKIKRMCDKDNFWQMGETGACGPCSEIFIDQGPELFNTKGDYFGGDGDRFLEIWNLVFMQYERSADGSLKPLPKPSIDTGMGLERMQALLEGQTSNFHSSLFMPLIHGMEIISAQKYENNPSFRVIADHARAICFLLAQGVLFDKEGRGYVARRILRRALRHGYLLGLKEAFLYKIVDIVIEKMGGHYQYLVEKRDFILSQCRSEEERFLLTLEQGMGLFKKELDKLLESKDRIFSGDVAFKLYDTFGFPLDLTQDMLKEHNFELDFKVFEKNMQIQKDTSRANWKGSGDEKSIGDFGVLLERYGINDFVGYESSEFKCAILALMDSNFQISDRLQEGESGFILLDKTPFFPQGGGAIGDVGEIVEILESSEDKICQVLDTKKYFDLNISSIKALREIKLSDFKRLDSKNAENIKDIESKILLARVFNRPEIAKHHSATHLLHAALREILGPHVSQAGSLVDDKRLRFDFTHSSQIDFDTLEKIQDRVNELIFNSIDAKFEFLNIEEAKRRGAIALFNEKYDDIVRVLSFAEGESVYSMELCGGIHVENTGLIGSFFITKEGGVSSGVRRIEAVCGKSAYEYARELKNAFRVLKSELKSQDIKDMLSNIKKLKLKNSKLESNTNFSIEKLNDINFISQTSTGDIKSQIDGLKNKFEKIAICLIEVGREKLQIFLATKNVGFSAKEWVKALETLGVKGGGRDDFLSAGCREIGNLENILRASADFVRSRV